MAIDKALVKKKLKTLEEFVSSVENMSFTADELLRSKDIQDLISFRIQQAVETIIDIANHLASGLNLPQKDTAVDVFILLGENKILSQKLVQKLTDACRFRNIIVHRYAKIDFKKLYRNYKDDLNDLRRFAKEISLFLERKGK